MGASSCPHVPGKWREGVVSRSVFCKAWPAGFCLLSSPIPSCHVSSRVLVRPASSTCHSPTHENKQRTAHTSTRQPAEINAVSVARRARIGTAPSARRVFSGKRRAASPPTEGQAVRRSRMAVRWWLEAGTVARPKPGVAEKAIAEMPAYASEHMFQEYRRSWTQEGIHRLNTNLRTTPRGIWMERRSSALLPSAPQQTQEKRPSNWALPSPAHGPAGCLPDHAASRSRWVVFCHGRHAIPDERCNMLSNHV